jgi:hypothetical protein
MYQVTPFADFCYPDPFTHVLGFESLVLLCEEKAYVINTLLGSIFMGEG